MQGIITSPQLSTTLIYNVSRRWITYLNRCVATSSLEDVGVPRATVPFSLEPILLDMKGERYVGPLLPATLAELVSGRCGGGNINGGGGSGSGGSGRSGGNIRGAGWRGSGEGTGEAGGYIRVWMRCEAHLPPCNFSMGKTYAQLWRGRSSPWTRAILFARTGTCADYLGRTLSIKNLHVVTSPDLVAAITGLLSTVWWER